MRLRKHLFEAFALASALLFFALCSPGESQNPPRPAEQRPQTMQDQTTGQSGAVVGKDTRPTTEEWLKAIESTYAKSQEDLKNVITVVQLALGFLAIALTAAGVIVGVDVRKTRQELEKQRSKSERQGKVLQRVATRLAAQMRSENQRIAEDNRKYVEELARQTEANRYASHALLYRMHGHLQQARESLDLAIRAKPADAYLYWQRAYVLEQSGRLEQAVEDCQKALECDATFSPALKLKGYCLLRIERFAEAVKSLEEALNREPDDTFTIYNLAVSYGGLRDRAKVLQNMTRLKCYDGIEKFVEDARQTRYLSFLREDAEFQAIANSVPRGVTGDDARSVSNNSDVLEPTTTAGPEGKAAARPGADAATASTP